MARAGGVMAGGVPAARAGIGLARPPPPLALGMPRAPSGRDKDGVDPVDPLVKAEGVREEGDGAKVGDEGPDKTAAREGGEAEIEQGIE